MKFKKQKNKKEVLPSFLQNLNEVPEDIVIPMRKKKSASYLGPVFFGKCVQDHPPHHAVSLSSFHNIQFFEPPKENILENIYLPKTEEVKKCYKPKTFCPVMKKKKKFVDTYPHKCPGVRKVYAPEPWVSEGLGCTKSIIEGETNREILFYRLRTVPFDCFKETPEPKVEIVTLSDLREEKRVCMSHNERMAHAHFPKEFVTLRIIGPTIPESITITKIPSRRQKSFEVDDNTNSAARKTETEEKVDKMETERNDSKEDIEKEVDESKLTFLSKQKSELEEKSDNVSERRENGEIEEKDDSPESQVALEGAEEVEGDDTQAEAEDEAGGLDEEGEERLKGNEKSVMSAAEENKSSLKVVEEETTPES